MYTLVLKTPRVHCVLIRTVHTYTEMGENSKVQNNDEKYGLATLQRLCHFIFAALTNFALMIRIKSSIRFRSTSLFAHSSFLGKSSN